MLVLELFKWYNHATQFWAAISKLLFQLSSIVQYMCLFITIQHTLGLSYSKKVIILWDKVRVLWHNIHSKYGYTSVLLFPNRLKLDLWMISFVHFCRISIVSKFGNKKKIWDILGLRLCFLHSLYWNIGNRATWVHFPALGTLSSTVPGPEWNSRTSFKSHDTYMFGIKLSKAIASLLGHIMNTQSSLMPCPSAWTKYFLSWTKKG